MTPGPSRIAAFCVFGVCAFWLAASYLDPLSRFSWWLSYQSMTNPMWGSGFFAAVDLPATASAADVVREDLGTRSHYTILETRRFSLPPEFTPSTAVRVRRDENRIDTLLLTFHSGPNPLKPGKSGYWNVRMF